MTALPAPLNNLLIQLKRQDALARELERLLESERAALSGQDPLPMAELAASKVSCLAQLEEAAGAWELSLRQLSQGRFGLEGFSRLLSVLPSEQSAPLSQAWADLKFRLENCQMLNSVNGRVIAISQRSVERNLNLLKGRTPESEIYTAQGRATGFGNAYRVQKV